MTPLLMLALLCSQSLGEIGRREAERRRGLEAEGGGGGRTIAETDLSRSSGNLGTFSTSPGSAAAPPAKTGKAEARASPARYRSAIQRLDRAVRAAEDRLSSLRARVAAERWAPPKKGRGGGGDDGRSQTKNLELQIGEWETKLKRLREERFETYDAGRKAGFLPGELDGKGIIP